MMLDIDCFKLYNDTYGHLMGDQCLKTVANTLKDLDMILASRYGGEEFSLIIRHENANTAKAQAEQIRKTIENLKIPHRLFTK